MKGLAWRIGVPLVLLAVYLLVWSPARSWAAEHVVAPALGALAAPAWSVEAQPTPPSVRLAQGTEEHAYSLPAGRAFLVPALLLAAAAPRRLLWLRLLGVLLALGVLSFALVGLGARGISAAWLLHRFLEGYVVVPLSVGLPLLWLSGRPSAEREDDGRTSVQRAGAPSILFVNQHYAPDFASTGQHLTDLAEYLAADGFRVRVLCGRGGYLRGQLATPAREVRNGVEVHRAATTGFGRRRHVGRLADYATFYAGVLRRLLTVHPADLVVFLTTPPLLPFAGALVCRLRGVRYGVWAMDLHPDAEEAVGMIRPGGLRARLLHRFADAGYRHAHFVVDLGPFMKARLVEKGVELGRLHTIPVWSRRDEVEPIEKAENPLAQELELVDRFVVMYAGNAGLVHQFDAVCEVTRRFRDDSRFFFLFVGSGPRRAEIESFATRESLQHFQYLDYVPRARLQHTLPLGDVHLLTLRNEAAGVAVPGKLYGIMAAGRPVVVVGPAASEPARTVEEEGTGLVVDTSRLQGAVAADALEAALRTLQADPLLRARMGASGRTAFLARYERDGACRAWSALLRAELGMRNADSVLRNSDILG